MNATMKDIFYHALSARAAYADMKKLPETEMNRPGIVGDLKL